MAYDDLPQLWGRTLRPALRQTPTRGPRHLWDHSPGVPEMASLIVYNDGTVLEGWDFESWETTGPNIHTFIVGGSDFRCEGGSDIHGFLIAAGYTFGFNTGG